MNAYDELVDVIATGPAAERIVRFRSSDENQRIVADLLERAKTNSLTPQETSELDHYLQFEHLIRLAKARGRIFTFSNPLLQAGLVSSSVPAALRRVVMQRANGVCEYCLVREQDSSFDFQIEHIISEKHGGSTTGENLACSCVFCNRFKGSDVASVSPTTGQLVRLYNPRRDRWADHFEINGPLIVPITEVAEATVRLLRFNDEDRVLERKLLQAAGRYP